jgi:hypothetical protein
MQPRDLAMRRAGLGPSVFSQNPKCTAAFVALLIALGIVRNRHTTDMAARAVELDKLRTQVAHAEYLISKLPKARPQVKAEPRAAEPLPVTAVPAPADPADSVMPPLPKAALESIEQQQKSSISVEQPLPECSVVFFHHLEKTAGTTLRSILQRNAQLGLFDFFSFINRYNKLQFQMLTHRLDTLAAQGGAALKDLRLAVEIHIGGGGYEHFLKYTMPDLLLLRKKLRGAGCRCNLVTLLRHPLTAHMSWHHHFVNQRVPLCFWNSPYDCQARMSIALACHGGPSVRPLTTSHRTGSPREIGLGS